jgi:hypothetical protein
MVALNNNNKSPQGLTGRCFGTGGYREAHDAAPLVNLCWCEGRERLAVHQDNFHLRRFVRASDRVAGAREAERHMAR